MSTTAGGPLSGITVIDLTRVLAGPYCTMVLSDLGARVIKVERKGVGDDARHAGPFVNGVSAYFASLNRGKESVSVDLRDPESRTAFDALLDEADVLIENFSAGVMDRLDYGWNDVHARWPRLVYASVSGFGHTGPYADRGAYDVVVQAMGGVMSITGEEGGGPVRVGTSVGDITAGLFTTVGILAALHDRDISGEGRFVDVAMLDCQVAILENAIARFHATGEAPRPLGTRHPSIAPFAAFHASDGYVVIAAGNNELFSRVCESIGLPALADDPRFASNDERIVNVDALTIEIDAALASDTVAGWLTRLEDAGVPCGPLNDIEAVVADPQVRARNMLVTVDDPRLPGFEVAGNPIKISGFEDPTSRGPVPDLGETPST